MGKNQNHSKIIKFVSKEKSKWYGHLLLNEICNLVTTNTINFVAVLLFLDTIDQLNKILKQNIIQCLDKLKVLYQIGQTSWKTSSSQNLK